MTIKSNLKELALYSITPMPWKYHFEGIDNRRVGRNFTIATLALNVGLFAAVFAGPVLVEKAQDLTAHVKNRFKKD